MVDIARLDPAILDNILLEFLEQKERSLSVMSDDGLDLASLDYDYFPAWKLYRLLFVCKGWHSAVRRRLYYSVGLGDEEPEWAEERREERRLARAQERASMYGYAEEYDEDEEDDEDYEWDDEDSDESSDNSGEYLERHERLLRTLSAKPELAALVYELRLGVMDDPRPVTKAYGQIIGLCTNVRHVNLHGWSYQDIQDVRDALRGTQRLEAIEVHAHSLRDIPCDNFMKLDELFYYLITFWPNLRSATFHNEAIRGRDDLVDCYGWRKKWDEEEKEREEREKQEIQERRERGEEVEEREKPPPWPYTDPFVERKLPDDAALRALITSPPANACANLRELTIREGDAFRTVHLRALARIAPHLRTLRIHVYNGNDSTSNDPEQLREALKVWAPTLEDAIIRPIGGYSERLPPLTDASFFAQFHKLHTLRTGSALIACTALVDVPKLTRLHYVVAKPPQDVDALVEALPKFKALKRLEIRPRTIYSTYDLDDKKAPQEQLVKLREACKAQGVKLELYYDWRK